MTARQDDDDPAADWAVDVAQTQADGVPIAVDDSVTAEHGMADVLEQARRRGYEQAAGDVLQQLRDERETVLDVVRAVHLIFEMPGTWADIDTWIRRRLPPL